MTIQIESGSGFFTSEKQSFVGNSKGLLIGYSCQKLEILEFEAILKNSSTYAEKKIGLCL